MKTDSDIKRDVEAELKWDPDIDATDIAVAVKNGVVTLTGFARSYTHKWQAESDAKRVAGVMGVANDVEVRLGAGSERADPEIARDAVAALENELPYSSQNMKVVVRAAGSRSRARPNGIISARGRRKRFGASRASRA
jgi:osmotically-inducible protein OsmY